MSRSVTHSLFGNQTRGVAISIAYGVAFVLAHHVAHHWGGLHFYSLWYPAAGVRLALFWHCGARYAPLVALYECLIQLAVGVVHLDSPTIWNDLGGVARSPLIYGAAISLVRWMQRLGTSDLSIAPMPFGLASVLAPTATAFTAGLWEWIRPSITPDLSAQPFATTIAAFLVGDLLGVLLIAPPLLWLASRIDGTDGAETGEWPPTARVAETGVVFCVGWMMAAGLARVDPQIALTPVLVTSTWVGLRCGRHGASVAIMLCAVIILPWSAPLTSVATRFALHMWLAGVAISAYLAGSFADAQAHARRDIARRDRMLFQAERLKTLRAMSVAVIHEISQPLSTLAIESRHLAATSRADHPNLADMAESAALIERKAQALADMVRRLRRFGGRAIDEPSALSMRRLVEDSVGILAGEARALRCHVTLTAQSGDLIVHGQEVELTQALLNLIRNAMAASPGQSVTVDLTADKAAVSVRVSNRNDTSRLDYAGMGIGTLVARAIVEAHGGVLNKDIAEADMIHHVIRLPLKEAVDG